jgi:peptidoglycan-associated lipoprotein
MTKRFLVGLALFMVTAGLIFTASCAKKQIKSEPGVAPAGETEAERTAAEQEARARQKALEEQRLREDIYFEFDKSRLLPEAKEILKRKAKWLMAHPNVSVIIEGHCDERGTNEYNMALGDRRAQSANSYLVDLGISRQRLTTISYGEERPVNPGHNERAWAENRRDQLIIE